MNKEKQIQKIQEYITQITPLRLEVLEKLSQYFVPTILKKNEFFVREGEYAKQVGFLQEGIVRAFFLNKEGKEYNKQFFVAPSIIGAYTSLLTKQANKIAQQALTDCTILVVDYSNIEALYDQYHELERLGRKIAENYFLEKEQKELEMALLDADKRYLLLREQFPQLEMSVSQYHIASYLGITPTQLSRIRKKVYES